MASPFVLVFAAGSAETNHQIALKFAPHHPVAFLCDREHDLKHAVKAAQDAGGEAVLFETELSSRDALSSSIAEAAARFGKKCAAAIFQLPDEAAAAAAAAGPALPFLQQTGAQFRQAATSQIASAYAFAQLALPLLSENANQSSHPSTLVFVGPARASRDGAIVNNALVALSRSLGREYGKKYIHVAHLKFLNGFAVQQEAEKTQPREGQDLQVAESLWHLYTQPLSCFSNELTI